MAEFAASIIGIGTAAGSAIKISKTIYHFCKTIHGAKHDIQAFAKDVETYGTVIRFAHLSLDRHLGSESPVLDFMDTQHVLVQLKQQADRVKVQIKQLVRRIRPLRNKNEWWTRVKWVWQKPDFEAVGPKMESVKSSLNVVVTFIMMEVMLQQEKAEANVEVQRSLRQQIKQLKRQVKVQMKTIEYFQELELRRAPFERMHNQSQPLISPVYEMQAALVDLGDSMVRHGTVPSMRSPSASSSSAASSRRHTHSHHGVRERRTRGSRRDYSASPRVVELSHPIPTARDAPSRELIPSPHSSVHQPPTIAGPSRSAAQSNNSRISLHLTTPSTPKTEPVILITPNGNIPFNALLRPDLKECLMYRGLATDMDISIAPLDEHKRDAWVTYEDGMREEIVEQAIMQSRMRSADARVSFTLRCFVFGREPRRKEEKLVLGRPYFEEERRVLGDGDAAGDT